jgi:hypothetical protein
MSQMVQKSLDANFPDAYPRCSGQCPAFAWVLPLNSYSVW